MGQQSTGDLDSTQPEDLSLHFFNLSSLTLYKYNTILAKTPKRVKLIHMFVSSSSFTYHDGIDN